MTNTLFLVAAALLLTGLAATPAEAYPFRFPILGRYRWWRRYSPPTTTPSTPPAHQCTCAPSPPTGKGGGAGGTRSSAADVQIPSDCVPPLGRMISCGAFLTGSSSSADIPAPGSDCCTGLAGFVDSVAVAGDSQLRCLCPIVSGQVNVLLPEPVDPIRMIFVPTACGVAVPPQVIPLCLNASSRFVTTMAQP